MNVKLVLLAFAAVIYQANCQFPFGNGGLFGQNNGIFDFVSMFRPQQFRPPMGFRPPLFGGQNQGMPPFFLPFFSQFRPQRPKPVVEPPEDQFIIPPADLEDAHPLEFVTPDELEGERPSFPQSLPESVEINEPIVVVEVQQPGVSEEVPIVASEENLFQIPSEEIVDVVEEEDIPTSAEYDSNDVEVEDPSLLDDDQNEIQQAPLFEPQVEIEEELPQDLPEEFIR